MQRSKLSILGIFVALVATSLTLLAQKRSVLDTDPPMRGIHWARGHQSAKAGGGNPDLIWHGGNIMETAQTAAIFWGSNWSIQTSFLTKLQGWIPGTPESAAVNMVLPWMNMPARRELGLATRSPIWGTMSTPHLGPVALRKLQPCLPKSAR